MLKTDKKFDIVVIGGGPAGMLAAGSAAENGARVAILEKNPRLGTKLLLTGNGRCNFTHNLSETQLFIGNFGKNGKFLSSAFSVFGPREVMKFFEKRGIQIKIEKDGRVFPATDKSADILEILRKYLVENKVEIICNAEVLSFEKVVNKIKSVRYENSGKILKLKADKFILATGGKSYPATGSTGDGFIWAKELGHSIILPSPALAPIKIQEIWIENLKGLSFQNINLSLWQNNKKQFSASGETLFTHFGLSGPLILNASKKIGELLKNGPTIIALDFCPSLTDAELDKKLQKDFASNQNKDLLNYLVKLFPRKLVVVLLNLLRIDQAKKINTVTKKERKMIVELLKNFRLNAMELMDFNQAMITSGGVSLREVHSKTMQSKIIDNLYFAGEILDVDGPTGGYNLQICWSTGYAAGTYATE